MSWLTKLICCSNSPSCRLGATPFWLIKARHSPSAPGCSCSKFLCVCMLPKLVPGYKQNDLYRGMLAVLVLQHVGSMDAYVVLPSQCREEVLQGGCQVTEPLCRTWILFAGPVIGTVCQKQNRVMAHWLVLIKGYHTGCRVFCTGLP